MKRSSIIRTLALCALALAFVPAAMAQLPATAEGFILDENGERIPGATIRITDPERPDFVQIETASKKGRYRVLLANGIVPYTFEFSAPGFSSLTLTQVKFPATKVTRRDFTLLSEAAAAARAAASPAAGSSDIDPEQAAKGGATEIFNKAVEAYNGGDTQTAEILFNAALEKNNDLGVAHAALGRLYLKKGEYAKAAASAERAVELRADMDSMQQVLYASYTELGDKDKAKMALTQLKTADPEKASKNLYNEAADLYNNGDMDGAKAGLEQVLGLDPNHARANYLLGMIFVSQSKNSEAKALLQKFLELAPDDAEAGTARSILEYLNG